MTTINYSSSDVEWNGDATTEMPFNVYIQLASRTQNSNFKSNRIGLLCDTISIATAKTVPSFPIPFSGTLTGESTTLALDLGMTSKTVSLSGIITDQYFRYRK